MLQEAIQLHQRGRLSEAESLYRKILARDPKHSDALHLLGVIALQRKNLDEALAFIDRALAIDPNNAAYHSNRAVALQDSKRFADALLSYDRALALRPGNPEILNNRGTVLRELKQFEDALVSYDRALALKPNYAEALNNRGNVLRDLKRVNEALSSYEQALKIRSDYADARSNFAQASNTLANQLVREGRLDEAIARYEHALEVKPDYVEALINLGMVFKSQEKLNDAIRFYRRALTIAPRHGATRIDLAGALLEQGKREEALNEAEAAARLTDDPSFPHFSLGVLFARCDRKDDAHRHLQIYLDTDPEDSFGARLILSALGFGPMPERASPALLRRLYEDRAGRWSPDTLSRGHELTADAVLKLCAGGTGFDILDAGCGTGLVGERLRAISHQLEGVDNTSAMLVKARERGYYDALHESGLVEFLGTHPARYDIIVSAATLIHFGDLRPVFTAAAASLRGQGAFVFTLFPNDNGEGVAVAPLGGFAEGGCFVHGRAYVERLAYETGFSVALMETGVHEYDNHGRPVAGLIVALRRDRAP